MDIFLPPNPSQCLRRFKLVDWTLKYLHIICISWLWLDGEWNYGEIIIKKKNAERGDAEVVGEI